MQHYIPPVPDSKQISEVMSDMAKRRWANATDAERARQGAMLAAGRRKARLHRRAKARQASKESPR